MPPIPDSEPPSVTAGDSISWTISLPLYLPVDGWALSYSLQGPAQISFSADADGNAFDVTVASADSAKWAPGSYAWARIVTNTDGSRITVARGSIFVLPNPAATAAQSHAQRALWLIECALERRIPAGLEETDIDGQRLNRIPIKDLYDLKKKYKREVLLERDGMRAALGLPVRRNIGIRFVRP